MKDLYKSYLKKINKDNYAEVYSDFTSLCYKSNYAEMISVSDKILLPALMSYSKGDNGKLYNGLKRWVKSIKDENLLLQIFNICNMGMRVALELDTSEDMNSRLLSKFETGEYLRIYNTYKSIFDSIGDKTFEGVVDLELSDKELKIVDIIKSCDIDSYINPFRDYDKATLLYKVGLEVNRRRELNGKQLYSFNELGDVSDKILDSYISIVDKLDNFGDTYYSKCKTALEIDSNILDEGYEPNGDNFAGKAMVFLGDNSGENYTVNELREQAFSLFMGVTDFRNKWKHRTVCNNINISGELLKIIETGSATDYAQLIGNSLNSCLEGYSRHERFYRDISDLHEWISYMYMDNDYELENLSSDIECYNSDLFYLCVGLKLCLINNNKVVIDDFKNKVNIESIFKYVKYNCTSYFKDKVGNNWVTVVNELLSGNEEYIDKYMNVLSATVLTYIKTGDIYKFEEKSLSFLGVYWSLTLVDYFFMSKQDNNISSYVQFLSPNIDYCCMSGRYTTNTSLFSVMYESDFKALQGRKYIIPTNGIVAEVLDYSIYLREFDNSLGEHCISVIAKNSSTGLYESCLINLSLKTFSGFNFRDELMYTILSILECSSTRKRKATKLDITTTPKSDEFIYEEYLIDELMEGISIDIKSPYYWKYRGEHRTNPKLAEYSPVTSGKEIIVNAFVRKLPKSEVANLDRQKLAKKYCITLEPGYTIVDSFTRKSSEGSVRTSTINNFSKK